MSALVEHVEEFLRRLEVEENASANTLRGYGSDLRQLCAFVAGRRKVAAADLEPGHLDAALVRGFLVELMRKNRKAWWLASCRR